MYHPIDMAFRQTTSSSSPEKSSGAGFNAAFSVNTLLNQSSPASITTAAHQHNFFSSLFQHYPYAAAFRPLFGNSSAFLPTGKKFKNNSHDENHCESSDEIGKRIQTLNLIKEVQPS